MAKIINYKNLSEVKKLLSEIYLEMDDGSEADIKFITFEIFNASQAKKKKIDNEIIELNTSVKYGKEFHSIKLNIINEKVKKEIIDAT